MTGVIVKGIGGFYYVETDDGLHECRARGIFRKNNITPAVGDRVRIGFSPEGQATVDEILPRTNMFRRPPVANVETMVLVIAARDPLPNCYLTDLFAVTAELAGAAVILCVNKMDLAGEDVRNDMIDMYGGVYPIHFVSGKTGEGIDRLEQALQGTQAALAGPSGVGKSTLLNVLMGEEKNPAGTISEKTARGRHTTRHTELFTGNGMKLFDTPGFTSYDPGEMEEDELSRCFPEIRSLEGSCRFQDCRHVSEPDCAVLSAVEEGRIAPSRYRSYKEMLKIIRSQEKY
ncbi:MAG: ribosome small subunit-dependent GTPase A [Clostridiales bacterium]|nr:ribosome small subunit-dependent GTPase A [Clostridiales bacterium]